MAQILVETFMAPRLYFLVTFAEFRTFPSATIGWIDIKLGTDIFKEYSKLKELQGAFILC